MTPRTKEFDRELLAAQPAFARYCRGTFGFAWEDVMSEANAKALAAHERFEPGSSMLAWLIVIARNWRWGQLKRERRVQSFAEVPEVWDNRTMEGLEARAELSALEGPFGALSPLHQALLIMRMGGLSYEDIARERGVPEGTVKSAVGRAREKLRAGPGRTSPGDSLEFWSSRLLALCAGVQERKDREI